MGESQKLNKPTLYSEDLVTTPEFVSNFNLDSDVSRNVSYQMNKTSDQFKLGRCSENGIQLNFDMGLMCNSYGYATAAVTTTLAQLFIEASQIYYRYDLYSETNPTRVQFYDKDGNYVQNNTSIWVPANTLLTVYVQSHGLAIYHPTLSGHNFHANAYSYNYILTQPLKENVASLDTI